MPPKVVPPLDVRRKEWAAFLQELKDLHQWEPKDLVLNEAELKQKFSADKSHHAAALPVAAVLPGSIELVAAIVRLCNKHHVPITPRGAGTGLEGGCIPYAGGLVVDTSRLRTIRLDEANGCVWAGAGVHKLELNRAAGAKGFLFGPDPASNPSVGGMVSTSGSGMSTLRYGTTRENVLSLRVVTAKGEIIQTRQVVRKSSAGLELTQLYIGSEGTLGIVCEACFRLFPITRYSAGAYATFTTTEDAVKAVVALRTKGVPHTLLRCEFLNKSLVEHTNKHFKLTMQEKSTVLLEFVSNDSWLRDIKADYKKVAQIFKDSGNLDHIQYTKTGKDMDRVWDARRYCGQSVMRNKKFELCKHINTDVCVPLSALAKCVADTEKDFAETGVPCIICAHISDGNFHSIIPYANEKELKVVKALEHRLVQRAIALGGTCSGEHGIGVGKIEHLLCEHGHQHIATQETIKRALDPNYIMNPGAFYPSQIGLYPNAHL